LLIFNKIKGFECCDKNIATYRTDNNGSWGIEVTKTGTIWCGIEDPITEDVVSIFYLYIYIFIYNFFR